MQGTVQKKYRESVKNILDTAKTFFINEFQEVLFDNKDEHDIEKQLASVPGLLIDLFSHVVEQNKKRKRNRMNRVTFSTVEDVPQVQFSVRSTDSIGLESQSEY